MITVDYKFQPRKDILCIDVKSFFASVESVKRGIHPLDSYIVVMSNQELAGGLVLASSPRVKKEYGIKTGSRKYEIPLNSKIQIVEPRMSLYIKVNMLINDIFKEFVAEEDIHIYSIDESFLDVSKSQQLYGTAEQIAEKIQQRIFNKLRLVTAIGIGDNPLLAKLALDNEAKNNDSQIAIWRYEDVQEKVWSIHPISKMWGIGSNTERNLQKLGIDSVYSLSQYNVKSLKRIHGIIGEQLFFHAHGIDQSILSEKYKPQSKGFGKSQILKKDYTDQYDIEVVIREMADDISARLRKHKVETEVVHLSIGFSREILISGFSHQMKIYPSSSNKKIIEAALHLFREHYKGEPVRQIAIRCGKIHTKQNLQLDLFEVPERMLLEQDLEIVIDKIRNKYGFASLVHASSLTKGGTAIQRSGLVGGHKG